MTDQHHVAVVGAGPSGLFGARSLAEAGVDVTLFNRDIKPGGLAEYGIYPDKLKMKIGLRAQFHNILSLDGIRYFGNISIGNNRDLQLQDLFKMGFDAVYVTAGAQGVKHLGLDGENLAGIYHAKDVVYHYNLLPPFSLKDYQVGKHVAVIGAGNVMVDITRWLVDKQAVEDEVVLVRRGPGEVKFDRMELAFIAHNIDLAALEEELKRVSSITAGLGQDPYALLDTVKSCIKEEYASKARPAIRFQFLSSPASFTADAQGRLAGIRIEHNTLIDNQGTLKAKGLGEFSTVQVENLIFAIGDAVDENLGLKTSHHEYVLSEAPRYPIEGVNYEIDGRISQLPEQGIFIAGWSRQSSYGLVGQARKDGMNGAKAVLTYLDAIPANHDFQVPHFDTNTIVNKDDIARLIEREQQLAAQMGLPDYKYKSNEEMLAVLRG